MLFSATLRRNRDFDFTWHQPDMPRPPVTRVLGGIRRKSLVRAAGEVGAGGAVPGEVSRTARFAPAGGPEGDAAHQEKPDGDVQRHRTRSSRQVDRRSRRQLGDQALARSAGDVGGVGGRRVARARASGAQPAGGIAGSTRSDGGSGGVAARSECAGEAGRRRTRWCPAGRGRGGTRSSAGAAVARGRHTRRAGRSRGGRPGGGRSCARTRTGNARARRPRGLVGGLRDRAGGP